MCIQFSFDLLLKQIAHTCTQNNELHWHDIQSLCNCLPSDQDLLGENIF